MRHDIDNHPAHSLKLAQLEAHENVHSAYFVLLTSDFYNVFSRRNRDILREIMALGHDIGLHFDIHEAQLLSAAIDAPVKFVSMHRPSKSLIEADLEIPGMYNAYSKQFCGWGG